MKFSHGDETDRKIVQVISHEFSRAQLSFKMFVNMGPKNERELAKQSYSVNLLRYNAYALFVQHLYEYLVACAKRDRQSTKEIHCDELDKLINIEIGKTLRNWVVSIDHGFAPEWANDRSFYDVDYPEEFGTAFRQMRNSISHADIRRIDGGNRMTLTDFYLKYHKFIYLLYENALHLWEIDEHSDIGDVTNFNKEIYMRPMQM